MTNTTYTRANQSINNQKALMDYIQQGYGYALVDEVEGKIIEVSEIRAGLTESEGKFIINIASQIHSLTA